MLLAPCTLCLWKLDGRHVREALIEMPARRKKPGPTAAERKRRERARARAGRLLLRVEVTNEWVEWLLDRKLLRDDQVESPEAIGRAIMKASRSGLGSPPRSESQYR